MENAEQGKETSKAETEAADQGQEGGAPDIVLKGPCALWPPSHPGSQEAGWQTQTARYVQDV